MISLNRDGRCPPPEDGACAPSSTRPALIELHIRLRGRWHLLETIDPASPEFACSASPADYAWFEAMRLAARLRRADPSIKRCALRRAAASAREARHGLD